MGDITDKTLDINIWNDEYTKKVSVITDGSIERLAIDGTITSDDSPTKYQLKTDFDATGDTLGTGADTTLSTFTGAGVLDFIAVTAPTSSNFLVALVVDGVERFRINMAELGTDLGLTAGTTPMWTETANKAFRFYPQDPMGFTMGFSVIGRSTVGSVLVKHITMYREKVA